MSQQRISGIAQIPSYKKKLNEKSKYQKHIWGSLFLELLLTFIWEKEMQELYQESDEEEDADRRAQTEHQRELYEWAGNPWSKEDKLEILVWGVDETFVSDEYSYIEKALQCTADGMENEHLHGSYRMLRDYYRNGMCEDELEERLLTYCEEQKSLSLMKTEKNLSGEIQNLCTCFLRANSRCAAEWNNIEGARLMEACGMEQAGTIYYNADYYYRSKRIENACVRVCNSFLDEFGMVPLMQADIIRNNGFGVCGGLSFHGVWDWVQQRNSSIYGRYSLKRLDLKPPKHFIYFYRNMCRQEEMSKVDELEARLREQLCGQERLEIRKWTDVGNRHNSNNGISALLEESLLRERQRTAEFLGNFRVYQIDGRMELLCSAE